MYEFYVTQQMQEYFELAKLLIAPVMVSCKTCYNTHILYCNGMQLMQASTTE